MKYSATELGEFQIEMKKQSLVGDMPIFLKEEFPWVDVLEKNHTEIRQEFEQFIDRIKQENLPNLQDISKEQLLITNDEHWKILPLLFYNEINKATVSCMPKTFSLINTIPGITTCFFSVLSPGKHIPKHKGPYAGVLRCHLAIKVPQAIEKCWITIDDIIYNWKEGEIVIFDDTYDHEVYNNTEETRVVLFIDFLRPLPDALTEINLEIMNEIQNTDFVKQPTSKYEQWEKKHLMSV
ncbi:aspartyl/asparaginyl beta-hydroxylase domain-containing protein [Flavobacterium sp. '19STA2R22 D10 B1']|uniref:aspartyl/asparaginyl beta-hydroxylase domain-containing protein n=1 Tax=Flavobacterium aerium TaxID=3037261 RepID=UPI00278C4FB5|nr:aspartyl/asparaginyl beta-hydroxylase domain-containing protein [Flavobacterium sp. '19STA2R22 D10 B1']